MVRCGVRGVVRGVVRGMVRAWLGRSHNVDLCSIRTQGAGDVPPAVSVLHVNGRAGHTRTLTGTRPAAISRGMAPEDRF